MAITNFNTSNQTFRKLMGNGLAYRVPMFQRDYSWTEQEWDELWQDIIVMLEPGGEQGHYMGYLVLQSDDERNFDIIDGQQRMTTLSLIVLAVLSELQRLVDHNVDAVANVSRITELRKNYIGYLDTVTLITRSKLTLNRHNDKFYQTYIVPLEKAPIRNLKASETLLRKGFDWFKRQISGRFADMRSGEELARFLESVTDRLFFTVISVNDELNAFKVFETLNARGVRLSSTDLLKNYLFSVVYGEGQHEQELQSLEERWETIVGTLGNAKVPDFLRVYWNSKNSLARHAELYKLVRSCVKDKSGVFQLLREMAMDANIYAALNDPGDPSWSAEQKRHIGELEMFGIEQSNSLLLAARRVLTDEEFTRVLRACSIISFRYNVIGGLATNEQERVYNSVAKNISDGNLNNSGDIIRALKQVYPSDEQFRSSFAEKQMRTKNARNKNVMRYILFAIERHIHTAYDVNDKRYSIEHILPESPSDDWNAFTDDQIERCVYRIGNMTLLERGPNNNAGNESYNVKKSVYEQSQFEVAKRIATEHDEWTEERIASRQQWLAKQATAIWRIAELSSV